MYRKNCNPQKLGISVFEGLIKLVGSYSRVFSFHAIHRRNRRDHMSALLHRRDRSTETKINRLKLNTQKWGGGTRIILTSAAGHA